MAAILLEASCYCWAILLWCIDVAKYWVPIIRSEEILAYGSTPASMTTKLNQKLLEDLRLQKRILLISENGCISPKQLKGSYGFPSSAEILQPSHNKRPINQRTNREDHGGHEYAMLDDEYGERRHSVSTVSVLNKTQRRSHVVEESWKQYEEASTSFKAFRDLPFYYHYNNFTDSNPILNQREPFKGIGSTKNSAHEHGIGGMPITSTSKGSGAGGGGGGGGSDVNTSRMQQQQQLEFDYYANRKIKRVSQGHHSRRSSVDLGEFNLHQQYFSDADHNVMQDQAYLQLREISRDAQKLSDILKLNSNLSSDGLIKSEKASDVGRDLLKGAMDLEESLRMLAKLQKAARNLKTLDVQGRRAVERLPNKSNAKVLQLEEPRNSYSGSSHHDNCHPKGLKAPDALKESTIRSASSSIDLREAIKSSLSRQKLLYGKRNSSTTANFIVDDDDRNGVQNSESKPANSNANPQDGKRRIPNVIARLMGLEELPMETRHKIAHPGDSGNSGVPSLQAQDLRLGHSPPVSPDAMNPSVASKSRDEGSARGSRPHQQMEASNLRQQQDWARRPAVTARESIEADPAHIKPKDQFHDTVKTALNRVKHHAPKPGVEFESLEKNHMRKHVDVDQDRKTLKEILESMQIKETLHPQSSGDGPLRESSNNSNLMASKSLSDRDNFRAGQKPARPKLQQEQKQCARGGNMPEIISTDHGTRRNSNDNKVERGTTTIVIMKPMPAKLQSQKIKQTQSHDHETESASGKSNKIQGIGSVKIVSTSSSPSKRKLGKGALGIKPDDGQSKKNNSNSGSHRGSRQAGTAIDHGGDHQKQLKPPAAPRPSSPPPAPPPPPPAVLQELKRRRNERISRTHKKPVDMSSSPSRNQEKKELVQTDPRNHIKKKAPIATKSIPGFLSGSTHNSPLDMQHKSEEKLPKELKSAQSHDALTIKGDEEEGEEREDQESSISTNSETYQAKHVISNVASVECASEEEETAPYELQSAVHNSPTADHSSPSISPISALELPAEVPHEDRSEDGESSTHIHLNDSDDANRDSSSQLIPKSYEEFSVNNTEEGYDDPDAKGTEFGEEYSLEWQADYVRQILMNNPTLANSGEEECSELYPQLYHKLEAQEAAMYPDTVKRGVRHGGHDNIAQRLVFDCVKELLKRKSMRRVQQVNHPAFAGGIRISLGMKRKNVEELVKELSEDIGELGAYHEVPWCEKYAARDDKFGADSLYTMLKKDLHLRHDVNSVWESSWDNGMFGEGEGQEIVREVEKVILEELLEEVVRDQVVL